MIKRYKPKWNILLRDDKTVSYVRIDMKSEIPYVSFTRTPQDDKATYIGPFYGKAAVEKLYELCAKFFRITISLMMEKRLYIPILV